jgi:hypothetical protein
MKNFNQTKVQKLISKKTAAFMLLSLFAFGAFATLGDGKRKSELPSISLLTAKTNSKPGNFSLRSGYTYRGSSIINTQTDKRVIRLNTVVTIQKGNTTYILPLKKNVLLGNVKIDIGNRQFKRN